MLELWKKLRDILSWIADWKPEHLSLGFMVSQSERTHGRFIYLYGNHSKIIKCTMMEVMAELTCLIGMKQ